MIKRAAGLIFGFGLFFIFLGGGCGYSAWNTAQDILRDRFSTSSLGYKTFRWCTNGLPFTDKLERFLDKTYIVLLQNNTELRATGGFAGSYARVSFDKKGLRDIFIEDIYQPDGQLPGHVEPPYPVQESFKQGWWKLRDANWDPDFASAAAVVAWFMEQGGEEKVDGIIAVNLDFMKKWLGAVGGVKLVTYDEKITEKNLYSLAQKYAEVRIEGNKTDKRGFLGAAGAALWEKTRNAGVSQLVRLLGVVVEELNKKQILVWMKDPVMQEDVASRRWDGGLFTGWDRSGDYIYVVDSNLGANKADCCISRSLEQTVDKGQPDRQKIILSWDNKNEFSGGKPPVFWGGNYVNYTRLIIPDESLKILSISVNGRKLRPATAEDFRIPNSTRQKLSEEMYATETRGDPWKSTGRGLQIVGFWVVVPAGEQRQAEIQLESSRNIPEEYKIWVKRQPGVEEFAYKLMVNGQIKVNERVDRDKSYVIKI